MTNTKTRRLPMLALCVLAGLITGLAMTAGPATAGKLVTGAKILDGSLSGADVAAGSVHSVDIADGSLTPLNVRPNPIALLRGEGHGLLPGEPGKPGVPGGVGPEGAPGVPGLHHVRYITQSRPVEGEGVIEVTPTCLPGTLAVSGGVRVDGKTYWARVRSTAPQDNGAGWVAEVRNDSVSPMDVTGWVVCALVG